MKVDNITNLAFGQKRNMVRITIVHAATDVRSVRSAFIPGKNGKVSPSPSLKPPHAPSHSPPHSAHSRHPSNSISVTPPRTLPCQRTPTVATVTSPAIELIRKMLYATLADVLASKLSLLPLLKSDPPRAYFGAVALAIRAVYAASIAQFRTLRAMQHVATGFAAHVPCDGFCYYMCLLRRRAYYITGGGAATAAPYPVSASARVRVTTYTFRYG